MPDTAPPAAVSFNPYEDGGQRKTQWWIDRGLYFGYEPVAPDDPAHPLQGTWGNASNAIKYRQDRHVLTVGPNGSGKTRRLLYPNLYALKNWSIVAIDPKGELFAHTAPERAKDPKHRVMLIDPFAVVETNYPHLAKKFPDLCKSVAVNPLAMLNPKSEKFVDDAKALAVALIKTDDARDKYWPQAAQALIKGMMMGLVLTANDERIPADLRVGATLGLLRSVLGKTPEALAGDMAALVNVYGGDCPPLTASLSEFTEYNAEDRELGGIRRTAKVQTDWLDSAPVVRQLDGGSFDFASIKQQATTIYLVLPPDYLASHGAWLRLMVTAILRPLLRSVEDATVPVLFMLDEFAQLGKMEIIEENYALMRGYGVKLWTIWQDLAQAETLYGKRWQSFIGNAGMVLTFAVQDEQTVKYLSGMSRERLNWHTTTTETAGHNLGFNIRAASMSSGTSTGQTSVKEPLIYDHEIAAMRPGQAVIFAPGRDAFRSYLPDATQIPGVADMMAEAEKNKAPAILIEGPKP